MHSNRDIELAHEREARMTPSPATDPDAQEALSRRFSDEAVILLQLRSGRFAVYNAVREYCGTTDAPGPWPPACWRAPIKPEREPVPEVDLGDLGLLI